MISLLQITNAPVQAVNFVSRIKEMSIEYAPKLLGAILVYLIGSWLIGKISSLMMKAMASKHYDLSLQTFLSSLVKVLLTVLLILTIFGMLGFSFLQLKQCKENLKNINLTSITLFL